MTKRIAIALSMAALLLLPQAVNAERYTMLLKRENSNLYKDLRSNIYIKTRYCHEYTYGDDAILDTKRRTIYFLDSKESCDYAKTYAAAKLTPGRYRVTVSLEDNDIYEVVETGHIIKTSGCLSLALMRRSILRIRQSDMGDLYFPEEERSCFVEGVFKEIRIR